MVSSVNTTTSAISSASGATTTSAQDMQDQFLTLLVAQLKNQDPTQPMDNAQLTSQMVQISTVSGIEKLNDTVNSVTSQFASMQMTQGTSLIGHTVLSEGNSLATTAEGVATAAFDLDSAASKAVVTITNSAGQLVDTVELSELNAGRNYFTWDASQYAGDATQLRYSVAASNGNTPVAATALAANSVVSASLSNGQLMLELGNGNSVNYNAIKAVF